MKKAQLSVFALCIGLVVNLAHARKLASSADDICYERVYSPEHMKKHKGQSLVTAKLRIYDNKYYFITGMSAKDNKEYSFVGNEIFKDLSLVCAGLMGDGDDYDGCIKFSRSDDSFTFSPAAHKYVSEGASFDPKGLTLIRCEGKSTDGEGCEAAGLKSIFMDAKNPEDKNYKLSRSVCR